MARVTGMSGTQRTDANPVIEVLGRRLRLAVIGGGPGSFIGAMHRTAARLDDCFEIVAGVLSSDPERSRVAGRAIGLDTARKPRGSTAPRSSRS
jgi:hypothetical protein